MTPLLAAVLVVLPSVFLPAARAEEFRGENCSSCHAAVRDRIGPASLEGEEQGTFDIAVIGGGLSGLSAAHFLKDFSVVVLEKEDSAGGQARTENIAAGPFPAGAFLAGEPVGVVKRLLDELKLVPRPVRERSQRYFEDGRSLPMWWEPEGSARQPYPELVRGRLFRLAVDLEGLRSDYSLTVPIENSDVRAIKKYDKLSLWDHLDRNYGREVALFGDLYSRARFGAGAKDVSAAVGLMHLCVEPGTRTSFEGGLGAVSRGLQAELKDRLRTEALVDAVQADKEGVTIRYLLRGRPAKLRAKAVILAVPAHVARLVAQGLSADKQKALGEVRTSAFLTVAFSMRKRLSDSAVLWTPGRSFASLLFPDAVFERPAAAKKEEGQVVVASLPMSPGEARAALLTESDEQIKRRVLEEIDKVFPGASGWAEDGRVIRWGHALPILGPGYLTALQPRLERPEGRLFFAGVETEVPDFEGAVFSGFKAARQARLFLRPESAPKAEPVDIPE